MLARYSYGQWAHTQIPAYAEPKYLRRANNKKTKESDAGMDKHEKHV